MKNILAENLLRFGVKNLTESQRKSLMEQNPDELDIAQPGEEANPLPDTPKSPEKLIGPKQVLTGNYKDFLLSLPNYDQFLKVGSEGEMLIDNAYFAKSYAAYLGADKNGYLQSLDTILGKRILRFKPGIFDNFPSGQPFSDDHKKQQLVQYLPGNSFDSLVQKEIIPNVAIKSFYDGETLRLINRKKVTTDWSGDPNNPVSTENQPNGDGSVPGGTSKTYDSYWGDEGEKRHAFANVIVPMEGPRGNTSSRESLAIPKSPGISMNSNIGTRIRMWKAQKEGWGSNWELLVNKLPQTFDGFVAGPLTNTFSGKQVSS
jgi:hypothetical protein